MLWDEAEGNTCDFHIARRRRTPRGRRPLACVETPRTGIGRSQVRLSAEGSGRPHRKAQGRNPMMHGPGKSDSPVVPGKSPNKASREAAEGMEGRGLAKGNSPEQNAPRTQGRNGAPSALERVRQAAKKDRKKRFTALFHHVYDVERLRRAYFGVKRDASPGIDGQTWKQYGEDLEGNLRDLSERLKRGAYRAKPARRAYVPKADGRQRPIGVVVLEDKIVQRSAAEVMSAIYEVDFLGFSYGFRPERSQHEALDALTVGIRKRKVNWVLDADLRAFFDTLRHDWLEKFVAHRIADQRMLRLIQKWLRAGVLEDGKRIRREEGAVQGGSISPLLANLYLHHVFDLWVRWWRKTQAHGDVIVVRFADDFAMGFEHRAEAERFRTDLAERLAKFGLELHPEKTRLIEFGRNAVRTRAQRGDGKPETFHFLGFTHACSKTKKGSFQVLRTTMRKRWQAKLREVHEELRRRINDPIPEQGAYLRSVVAGHVRYYGVPGNSFAIHAFRGRVEWLWRQALLRRSHKARIKWERLQRLAAQWLPSVRICHPWPEQRLGVRT